jgi:Arc/MetJ-type ribon-helix-helix transcriptional regulator
MGISITPEIEQLVSEIFATGQYQSEEHVLAVALQLLEQRDQLRNNLQRGCEELNNGQRLDGAKVFAELRSIAVELDGRSP